MIVEISWNYSKKGRVYYNVTEVRAFEEDGQYIVIRQDKQINLLMKSEIKDIIIKE